MVLTGEILIQYTKPNKPNNKEKPQYGECDWQPAVWSHLSCMELAERVVQTALLKKAINTDLK